MEKHLVALVAEEKDEVRLAKLNENLEYIQKSLAGIYGERAEETARAMLRVLGFDGTGEKAPLNSLSGGLRMRYFDF
jgi:ATPase subunit of ABC transporter with duplicated ATPase domains